MARLTATTMAAIAALMAAAPSTGASEAGGPAAAADMAVAARATQAWQAQVAPASRAGVRPPGRCLRLDHRAVACDVAMLVRVRPSGEVRVCRAVLLVRRAGPRIHVRRSSSDCRERAPAS